MSTLSSSRSRSPHRMPSATSPPRKTTLRSYAP
jgi:hypothetical protein